MSAATQNEMDRIARERDDMAQAVDRMQRGVIASSNEIAKLKAERDALAAHTECWKEWLGRDPEDDVGDWMDEGWIIAKESPTTSLARLKAEWQAEALRTIIDEWKREVLTVSLPAHISCREAELSRQAKGGD